MDSAGLQKYVRELFERHDVELEADEDGWLMTDGDFPALRASWNEGAVGEPGWLDIDVVLSEERRIEESFLGEGGGDLGCRAALRAFEHNAFHVLLAACWYVTDDRKIRIDAWDIGVRTWDVFVGPFTVHGNEDGAVTMPADAMTGIEVALKREALVPELHWLRLVHRQDADGVGRNEALLDNEPWAAGTQALSTALWPSTDTGYGARAFVMLDVRDY